MKDFKKRALILILASVVTVTGSFAADNYKNCIMNVKLKSKAAGEVSVILDTQKPFVGEISPRKTDSNTYIIMLPEVDNSAPSPDLSATLGNIQSVEMRKMPYSNGCIGYTKIVIKTSGDVDLKAKTALYVPKEDVAQIPQQIVRADDYARERAETIQTNASSRNNALQSSSGYSNKSGSYSRENSKPQTRVVQYSNPNNLSAYSQKPEPLRKEFQPDESIQNEETGRTDVSKDISTGVYKEESSHQQYLLGLLVVFVIMASIYFYLRAQDKMSNVIGEKLDIDLKESEEKKSAKQKSSGKHKISRTINKLDAAYSKTSVFQMRDFSKKYQKSEKEQVEENIVDLDALFKEQQTKQRAESVPNNSNTDEFDEFLRGFAFETDNIVMNEKSDVEKEYGYDENEFQKLLQKSNIIFSSEDIKCFKELLKSEVSDTLLNNIEKYAASDPIIRKKPSKNKILENLILDYSISRDITFNNKDIDALRKLISVELDEDFIKDLRVNPNRTSEMEKEIRTSQNYKIKPSEIVTLNVKDMLPDLSKALKKQGNRPVKSEAKPETIYFSEGYEVSKISVGADLPDLSKALNDKDAYASKPSDIGQVVDQSYSDSVQKLSISGLPDLADAAAHPDKYNEPKEKKTIVSEKDLLKSIKNVKFKPFDDGTRNFEIINNFDDETTDDQVQNIPIPDIEKEFSQFENFEVANTDEPENPYIQPEYDDFAELYSENFVNLDLKNINTESSELAKEIKQEEIKEKIIYGEKFTVKNLDRVNDKIKNKIKSKKSEELINKIKNMKRRNVETDREVRGAKKIDNKRVKDKSSVDEKKPINMKCVLEGVNYNVVGSTEIVAGVGCYLAKSKKGYAVLGYNDNEIKIIKEFDTLKTDKIQARLSETMPDGTPRYLIKVGANKFIVDVIDSQIVYVMDLC